MLNNPSAENMLTHARNKQSKLLQAMQRILHLPWNATGWLSFAQFAITASLTRCDTSSHGAGDAKVADELENEADNEVPDVASDLWARYKRPPQDNSDHGVEDVADVAKSAHPKKRADVSTSGLDCCWLDIVWQMLDVCILYTADLP